MYSPPVDFAYWEFAIVIALNGFGSGLFFSPDRAQMMNSVPPGSRGAAGGMTATFQNSAFVLSTGIFFTLMAAGLPGKLPAAMPSELTAQGVPAATAAPISHLPRPACCPPPSSATTRCSNCPARCCITCPGPRGLRGRAGVFPYLITAPSHSGPGVAFGSAITASVIAAAASALTGQGHADPAARQSPG